MVVSNNNANTTKKAETKEVPPPKQEEPIKPIETSPNIIKSTESKQVTVTVAQRKPKFEFFQNNNSVIFLDEIGKPTPTTAISESTNLKKDKVLNGIKFGFIDSSSSDEDISVKEEEVEVENKPEIIIPASATISVTSPKPMTKNKKYLLKTTSNSSSKSSSSLSLKTSAISSSHRTNSSTTSSDNDETEPTQKARKPKQKIHKSQSKNKLKATVTNKSSVRKSSDESSQIDAKTNQKSSINQNFYQHQVPVPPQPYIIYPNQMNAAYLNAYYAAVNHPNTNGNPPFGYPSIPGQIPVGMPSFYQGPINPQSQIHFSQQPKQQIQQQSPLIKPENTEQGSISTALSSTSSSESPLQANPEPETTKKPTESSQSANSSNSTTPTPSADTSQSNQPQMQQQQQPLAPPQIPLIQMNPDFYPPPPPYGPGNFKQPNFNFS